MTIEKTTTGSEYPRTACSGKIMHTIYDGGGSRIWMQYEDGSRDLLAQTYDGPELAKKILATIEAHFFPNTNLSGTGHAAGTVYARNSGSAGDQP